MTTILASIMRATASTKFEYIIVWGGIAVAAVLALMGY